MIIERDYADEAKNSSVDSGVDISYEGLSHTFMANMKGADEIKVSYANEELNDAIFYPSGASVGKEGFDE
jgi:hypothetical protein